MDEAIEVVDPVVKVFGVFFIAEVTWLGWVLR